MQIGCQKCTPAKGPLETGQASEQATESAYCPSICTPGLLGSPALPCLLRARPELVKRRLPGSEPQRLPQGSLQAWTSTWPQLQGTTAFVNTCASGLIKPLGSFRCNTSESQTSSK